MTDDEIKKLAVDIRSNLVFGTWNIRQSDLKHMLQSIFMPLFFMEKEDMESLKTEETVHLYEYISEAGPRAVNGYPTFMSCRRLNKTDTDKLFKVITALDEAEKKALAAI